MRKRGGKKRRAKRKEHKETEREREKEEGMGDGEEEEGEGERVTKRAKNKRATRATASVRGTLEKMGVMLRSLHNHSFQEKTPCADSACADCPGFLVSGAADARTPSFVREPHAVSLDWHLLHGPFKQNSWICYPSSPATRGKTGRSAQVFATQGFRKTWPPTE